MAKKNTFAQEAKKIKNKFYKIRKPGEDSLTDDAFNLEMQDLMAKQEAAKPPESQGQDFAKGGNLPKYDGISGPSFLNKKIGATGFSPLDRRINTGSFYQGLPNQLPNNEYIKDNVFSNPDALKGASLSDPSNGIGSYSPNREFDLKKAPSSLTSVSSELPAIKNPTDTTLQPRTAPEVSDQYSPTANQLTPLLSVGANAVASTILATGAVNQKKRLLEGIRTPKVQAQKVDFSRDRANIRSNEAVSEASGRNISKQASSASERARIQNAARLGSQRVAGNQLSQSLQAEESKNAELRSRADESNRLAGINDSNKRLDVEQRYGDAPNQILADSLRFSAGEFAKYNESNRQISQDENYLQAISPDLTVDYQKDFDQMTPYQQWLAKRGVRNVNKEVTVRNRNNK